MEKSRKVAAIVLSLALAANDRASPAPHFLKCEVDFNKEKGDSTL